MAKMLSIERECVLIKTHTLAFIFTVPVMNQFPKLQGCGQWSVSLAVTRSCANCTKYIESIIRGADNDTGQLWMPVKFFDLFLSLMYKQQLWRDIVPVTGRARRHHNLVRFNGKVPDCETVVGCGDGQYRAVVRIPFQRCDGCRVVPEWDDRTETGATSLNTEQSTFVSSPSSRVQATTRRPYCVE